jgi:hypothetical protein
MTRDTDAPGASEASPPPTAISAATQLRFDAGRTVLAPPGAPAFEVLVGPQALAARYWRDSTPSALQIEQAIDQVEMALMAARLTHGERGSLVTADPWLRALPGLQTDDSFLTRDGVELLFNALAAKAEAGRATVAGLATEGDAAAALLILRECMHHLGFDDITARAAGG